MRTSQFPLFTSKEIPAEAEVISHKLMLRSGMIHQIASGLYSWLPIGLRTLQKVEAIVREEMNASGAVEVSMPTIQPAELWKTSKRWDDYGAELLRLKDRHERDFVYGPTHEEVITYIAGSKLLSYRQLPVHFYQIQTKFRDEIRPRFGIMRAREFLMKDGYSFHLNEASLDETYQQMYATYTQILTRLQLEFHAVLADTGSIGGNESHEFHVLAQSGEDEIAFSSDGSYAANVELAPCPTNSERAPAQETIETISTPKMYTIEDLCKSLSLSPKQSLKAIFVKGVEGGIVALFLRGDHRLNATKASKHLKIADPLTFASKEEIFTALGCNIGSLGPVGLDLPIIADYAAAAMSDFVCGANKDDTHFKGVNWGIDTEEPEVADLRNIEAGDPSPNDAGKEIMIKRGIEVGHIFKLGKKYSELLGASVLNKEGKQQDTTMGCYGIGVSRIVAAAIEQNHDDKGIVWPISIAPFTVFIAPIGYHKSANIAATAQKIYTALKTHDIDVLLDDRDLRMGEMLGDADLIGIPYQVIIGERNLAQNQVEIKSRQTQAVISVDIDQCVSWLLQKIS